MVFLIFLTLPLILPIPAFILDILVMLNLIFALFILLIAEYVKSPMDFFPLPTLFIISANFGLLVNIFAAILILKKGTDFDGRLIRFASSWLAGSGGKVPLGIGLMFFIAGLAMHIMLIGKAAIRSTEISTWFTREAMPENQLIINAKLSTGSIDEKEFTIRKEALQKEADFYTVMDDIAKFIFVREKYRICIIALTILGGILIGIRPEGSLFANAVEIYVPLVIGNGLLSIIPVNLVSFATDSVITRS